MSKIYCSRYHDFSYGHRVVGHENKCKHLHGHNGRVHFECEAEQLDEVGRVIDFSVIKEKLCMWLEDNWDHKFLAWDKDGLCNAIAQTEFHHTGVETEKVRSFIFVPFNPTAENMALYLLNVIAPQQLEDTGVRVVSVTIEETAKCSAKVTI